MRKVLVYVFLFAILLSAVACPVHAETEYYLKADKIDLNAVNSYPQKLISDFSNNTVYELLVAVSDGKDRIKSVKYAKYDYPQGVLEYLKPTVKIESNSEQIKELANLICKDEFDIINIVKKTVQWTSKNITFDDKLAVEIWKGNVNTQSAVETVKRKKGTCSEYTNVFIAIMRALGIPARFISGYSYGGENQGSYHAWAEIYLYGIGWLPADPQMGIVGVTDKHIKLFQGKDYVNTGVPIKYIGIKVIKVCK